MKKIYASITTVLVLSLMFLTGTVKAQYCTPDHSTFGCGSDYIASVTFGTISNVTGCAATTNPYTYYTTPTTSIARSCSKTCVVACGGGFNEKLGIWIDFNADGDFADAGERVYNATTAAVSHNAPITIPATATLGKTRMRISCTYTTNPTADGCGTYNYGETEDYDITITVAVTQADAGPAQSLGCPNTCTLAGNDPGTFTGAWSIVTGSGNFANASQYNTGVTAVGGGTNTYRWTISNGTGAGACSTFDDVVITRSAATANAGPNQGTCSTGATLAGNAVASPLAGTWTVIAGGASVTAPGTANSGVTGLTEGANTFVWSVTDPGPPACTARDTMTINRVSIDTWTGLGAAGNWNDAANWDKGVPPACASVVIAATANGNQPNLSTAATFACVKLTINQGASLIVGATATLAPTDDVVVNGTLTNNGRVNMAAAKVFEIGPFGTYTHNPATSDAANATMFTTANETFYRASDETAGAGGTPAYSSLIIKKWYTQATVGLAANMNPATPHYGNVEIDLGSAAAVWPQNSQLGVANEIKGTLTVKNAYVELSNTDVNYPARIGNVVLDHANAILVGQADPAAGPANTFTLFTKNISITTNGGVFYPLSQRLFATPNNNGFIDVAGSITVAGGTIDTYLPVAATIPAGNMTYKVASAITVSGTGKFYGMHRTGTSNITGNLTLDAASINLSGSGLFMGLENGSGIATIGNTTAPAITIAGTASFTGVKAIATLPNAAANIIKTTTIDLTGGSFSAIISGTGTTTMTSGALTMSGASTFTGVSGVTGAAASGAFNLTLPSINLTTGTPSCNIGGAFGTGVFTTTIANDITVNAGTLTIKKDQGNATVNIAGNVLIGGGEINVCNGTNTAAIAVNINGDFALNTGVFEFEKGTPNATGTRTLTLKKNFTHAAGTFRGVNEIISTVVFDGAVAQTITGPTASTFNNLTLNNLNGLSLAATSPITVDKLLTLTTGSLTLGNSDLTMGAAAPAIAGTFGPAVMIVTNGTGSVTKLATTTATGSYVYPVGETTGITEYTPITINLTSGTFGAGAGVKVRVVDLKHPNNGSPANFLTRYWATQSMGITGALGATITGTYMPADINGMEAEIAGARYNAALPWVKSAALASNTVSITGAPALGDISGITLAAPTVTVNGSTNDSLERCEADNPSQLTALALGDGGFTYAWTPTIGLSSAAIANPIANPATTQTYTVTATDINGITASTTFKVKVVPAPTITLGASPALCSGITTANLPYTAVANNPTTYTIDYNQAAEDEGFVDITIPATLALPAPDNIQLTIPATATPAVYNATLTVISAIGCKSVPVAFTVTINPIPAITLGQEPRVCRGVTASALTYSGATGAPDQYKIDFDAVAMGEGFANVTYTALTPGSVSIAVPATAAPGVYNATITIKNSSTTCSPAPYSFTVTIDSIPTINLAATVYNVCQGATIADVTYLGTEGSPNQYKLTFDAAAKSEGFTDVPFTALPNSPITVDIPFGAFSKPYNVSIAMKTPFGCVSNPATAFKITINDYPDAPFAESPITYCQNDPADPLETYTGTNLLWYNDPPTGMGSSSAPTPTTTTPGTTIYYVSDLSAAGCESEKTPIEVQVNPQPSLVFDSLHCVAGQGETNTFLSYSAKINNPDIYGIFFDAAAQAEGFQNVGNGEAVILGDSPVVFDIPETAPVGTYSGQFGVQDTLTGCFTFQDFTIDIITSSRPTISLAANPVVCQGIDSTNLHYNSTTNDPDSYTIDFDPAAEAEGFTDISYTALGGFIRFAVPVNGTPGTYKATITVVNNTTADTSRIKGFKVTIAAPAPQSPSAIQGVTNPCPTSVSTFSVDAVPTATTYTWLVPTGWSILAGQGTTSVTVRVGSFGQDGNIVAIASNSCGSSPATTLAVTVKPPVPSGTSSISGTTAACPGANGLTYTLAPIAHATDYYWSVPVNWDVIDGYGTSTLTVRASDTPGDNGDIEVYTANECGFNSTPTTLAVTVESFATPTVAIALTNGTNPTCSTQPLTFTATPTKGGTAPIYQWKVNGVDVAGATTNTFNTASLVNNDNVVVAMTSNFNCANPATVTSNSITMSVKPIPTAPSAATPLTYCQNANAKPLEASGSNLLWYAAATGGASSNIPPKPSTAVVGTTSYYVSQTVSGCESPRAQIDVNITANPAAPTVTTPVNYCQNGPSPALTATGNTLLWYTTASGGSGSGTAPKPSTATISTITYYVTQTVSGCESSRQKIEAVINPVPAAPTASTPVTFCQNAASTALTANGSNLLWYTPTGGSTGTAIAPRPSTSSAGTKNYFVTQTVNTCESPKTKIEVIVIGLPPTPVPSANTPICSGSRIELKTPTVAGATYAWQGPNNFSSTQQNPVINNATLAMAGTYAVRAIANGCQSSPGGITVEINQSINTVVTIVRSVPFDDICAGTTVVFTAKPTNPGVDPQYKWKINGVVAGPNGTEFTTNSLANNDVVTCTMASSVTCPSPVVAVSNEKSFSVTDIPEKPSISQDASVLTSSSTKGNEWYFNGEYISGENSIVMDKTGQYKLLVTINGCNSPFSDPVDFVKEGTSVNSVTGIKLLNVFPNPTEENFTVSFNATEKATYRVVLFNSIGQIVVEEELKDFIGAYSRLMNAQELGKGVYSLSIIADKYQTTKKVVVY